MELTQIAQRISKLTGERVSDSQLAHVPEESRREFRPINERLSVLSTSKGIPSNVNFKVSGRQFHIYQASCYEAKTIVEAWDEITKKFEDMLSNPQDYFEFHGKLIDGL